MAVYTSTQSGALTDASTWGGIGTPTSGVDTIVISTGHTVTNASDVALGVSLIGTPCITINTGGRFEQQGFTLTLQGDVRNDGTFAARSGAIIEAIAGVNIVIYHGYASAGFADWVGSVGQRIIIRRLGASSLFTISTNSTSGFGVAQYVDFYNLGGSGVQAFAGYVAWTMEYCRFYACGQMTVNGTTDLFIFRYLYFWETVATSICVSFTALSAEVPAHPRIIEGCSFDIPVSFSHLRGVDMRDNYFGHPPTFVAIAGNHPTLYEDFVVYKPATPSYAGTNNIRAPLVNNGYLCSRVDNPQYITTTTSVPTQRLTNLIFEHLSDYTTNPGHCIAIDNPGTSYHLDVDHCITLPNINGRNSGSFIALLGNANCVLDTVQRNTFFAREEGTISLGESYNGYAGIVRNVLDNIAWAEIGSTAAKISASGSPVNNYVTMANYNAGWNLSTEYGGPPAMYATPPGVNDLINVDPLFVDRTRDLGRWVQEVLGYIGTGEIDRQNYGLAALRDRHNPTAPGYVPGVTITGFLDWIRAGFYPCNSIYATAASDGSSIGALDIRLVPASVSMTITTDMDSDSQRIVSSLWTMSTTTGVTVDSFRFVHGIVGIDILTTFLLTTEQTFHSSLLIDVGTVLHLPAAQFNRLMLLTDPTGTVEDVFHPTWLDISATYGADFGWMFTLLDRTTPVDLSADTVKLVVKQYLNETTELVEKINTASMHHNPMIGETFFSFTKAEFMALVATLAVNPYGTFYLYYEVRRLSYGQEIVHIIGKIRVEPSLDLVNSP